jgi:hypothetical protein
MRSLVPCCITIVLITQALFAHHALSKKSLPNQDDVFFSAIFKGNSVQKDTSLPKNILGVSTAVFIGLTAHELVTTSTAPYGLSIPAKTVKQLRQLYVQKKTEFRRHLQNAQRTIISKLTPCTGAIIPCGVISALEATIQGTPDPMRSVLTAIRNAHAGLVRTIIATACPIVQQFLDIPMVCTLIAHQFDIGKMTRNLSVPLKTAHLCPPDTLNSEVRYTYHPPKHIEMLTAYIDKKKHSFQLIICMDQAIADEVPTHEIKKIAIHFAKYTFPLMTEKTNVVPIKNDIYIQFVDLDKFNGALGIYHLPTRKIFINANKNTVHDFQSVISHEYTHMLYHVHHSSYTLSFWTNFFLFEGIASYFQNIGQQSNKYYAIDHVEFTYLLKFLNDTAPQHANATKDAARCFLVKNKLNIIDPVSKHIEKLNNELLFYYKFGSLFIEFIYEVFSEPMKKYYSSSDPYLVFKHLFQQKNDRFFPALVQVVLDEPWPTIYSLSQRVLNKTGQQLCIDFIHYTINQFEKMYPTHALRARPLINSLKKKMKWLAVR